MRWKRKFPPDDAKLGESWLFVKRPGILPRFLDCGCVVWDRPFMETHRFGHTLIEEIVAGIQVRPHRWAIKTTCINCLAELIGQHGGDKICSIDDFLDAERESGVHVEVTT